MAKTPKKSYTDQTTELQEIIEKLESGGLDIDAAVDCYGRGLKLVVELQSRLTKAGNTVATLREPAQKAAE